MQNLLREQIINQLNTRSYHSINTPETLRFLTSICSDLTSTLLSGSLPYSSKYWQFYPITETYKKKIERLGSGIIIVCQSQPVSSETHYCKISRLITLLFTRSQNQLWNKYKLETGNRTPDRGTTLLNKFIRTFSVPDLPADIAGYVSLIQGYSYYAAVLKESPIKYPFRKNSAFAKKMNTVKCSILRSHAEHFLLLSPRFNHTHTDIIEDYRRLHFGVSAP